MKKPDTAAALAAKPPTQCPAHSYQRAKKRGVMPYAPPASDAIGSLLAG